MSELDVTRREDFMRTPGQSARLTVGPFEFEVNTADGLMFGFSVSVWRWSFAWLVDHRDSAEGGPNE